MKQDKKIVLNFALIFFLYLCVLDIAILYLHHTYATSPKPHDLDQLTQFFYYIVLWELILVIVVSYVFYELFRRYQRHKQEVSEFQDILVKAVSHRMGNFLAVQKVNVELLRQKNSPKALDRIEEATLRFENDFQQLIKIMDDFSFEERSQEPLDFKTLTENILPRFAREKKLEVKSKLQKAVFKGNILEVQTLLFILLENAVKYAGSSIIIRTGTATGRPYFFLKNDKNPRVTKGTGIGSNIASRLCSRNDLFLRQKESQGRFKVLVMCNRKLS
ncbi:MAG: hypothetical protein K9K64_03550 [Desulfohalobiaceae bacterium]|nr:hypothetical protein [Desulfohalobiaceae bacterium]